ncbi:carbon storage regulator [Acidithiobacillus sp.]|uniref:carbon storage regulator n=1 Tax=Acidithiobacillus sp. TaxID=1872118 RepID=UPI00261DADC4|nr:carbon storage regulator [Acidithiobacillus sp.]
MLVLTRRRGQAICIGDDIRIVVTRIEDGQVRLGIESAHHVTILREELLESVRHANRSAQAVAPVEFGQWLQSHRPPDQDAANIQEEQK